MLAGGVVKEELEIIEWKEGRPNKHGRETEELEE